MTQEQQYRSRGCRHYPQQKKRTDRVKKKRLARDERGYVATAEESKEVKKRETWKKRKRK